MARSFFLPLIAFSLLAGCSANPPVLTAENPASPQAPEANVTPLSPLKRDAITQRTRQMLAQAAKQQEEWDQNGPSSGDQPGVKQQQPQQKQMEQMRGMQMRQEQTQPSPTPSN
jgi:uncharacterized lipoprotein YajG